MADKKVTTMVIKVDLNCEKCRKKIKKVLCDIPHIQNQVYDEKANTVTITVVCCNPEKIKKKICCKGGKTVKGIEIKVPEKPKRPEEKAGRTPKTNGPKKNGPDTTQEPEKMPPAVKPPAIKPPSKPAPAPVPMLPVTNGPDTTIEPERMPLAVKPPSKPSPEPVPCYPPPTMLPRACCRECYEGRGGGPCFAGRGMPAPPCYGGYGRLVYDSWGGGVYRGPSYVGRCDYYQSEENPAGCIIM